MMITSLANERVKNIRKLQERKSREESGLFLIEGLRVVAEAIEQSARIDTLVVAPELLKSAFGQELLSRQQAQGTEVLEVSREVFLRISAKDGPQGIAAVVHQRWERLAGVAFHGKPGQSSRTWVALESVADPGNLGAIMRTHDAVGGEGIILLDQSTDPYDPAAAKASMGALFTQKLVKTSLAEFAEWKRRGAVTVIGTSDKAQLDYTRCRYPADLVLLMGSERQGLSEAALALCDEVAAIPMVGASDSLNLAVATAVMLYEIFNQRRAEQ